MLLLMIFRFAVYANVISDNVLKTICIRNGTVSDNMERSLRGVFVMRISCVVNLLNSFLTIL